MEMPRSTKETIAHNPSNGKLKYILQHLIHGIGKQYYEQSMSHCVDRIGEYLSSGYKPEDILILARIVKPNVIKGNLSKFGKMKKISISTELNNPHHIHLMSVHKSKGLQARVVFILDVVKGLYGFPCEKKILIFMNRQYWDRNENAKRKSDGCFMSQLLVQKRILSYYTKKDEMSDFLKEINEHLVAQEKI